MDKLKMKNEKITAWGKIIETIDRPLGFFVLALLIVESFLGLVLGISKFDTEHQYSGMLWGIALFVFVVFTVTILVWFKPENLTYDKDAHLAQRRRSQFGTEKKQVKNVDELLPTQTESAKEEK
jgi:hypothetical protein